MILRNEGKTPDVVALVGIKNCKQKEVLIVVKKIILTNYGDAVNLFKTPDRSEKSSSAECSIGLKWAFMVPAVNPLGSITLLFVFNLRRDDMKVELYLNIDTADCFLSSCVCTNKKYRLGFIQSVAHPLTVPYASPDAQCTNVIKEPQEWTHWTHENANKYENIIPACLSPLYANHRFVMSSQGGKEEKKFGDWDIALRIQEASSVERKKKDTITCFWIVRLIKAAKQAVARAKSA